VLLKEPNILRAILFLAKTCAHQATERKAVHRIVGFGLLLVHNPT
jgi:hypothetical protein